MSEIEQRAAFDAWCKAAPDGWEPILATPGKWIVWQAACEWATERAAKILEGCAADLDEGGTIRDSAVAADLRSEARRIRGECQERAIRYLSRSKERPE